MTEDMLSSLLPFWAMLKQEERADLLKNVAHVSYHRGQHIHSPEQECVGVLVLQSGELRTYMLSEDGRDITLYRLLGGDVCILSASCIMRSVSFDVYIDAEQDCTALLIPAPVFAKLQNANIYAETFALRAIADKFSDVMWAMQQILFMPMQRRLAIFLHDELLKSDGDTINLTHEQIARYMGSAREVVSRGLKQLEQSGILLRTRGGITVQNRTELKKLIG